MVGDQDEPIKQQKMLEEEGEPADEDATPKIERIEEQPPQKPLNFVPSEKLDAKPDQEDNLESNEENIAVNHDIDEPPQPVSPKEL